MAKTSPALDSKALDQLCINTIRTLAMDAVQKANSGHPGTPMALAPLAYVLYTRHLRFNPRNTQWPDRDRFVLSAGHACMLQYAIMFLTGTISPSMTSSNSVNGEARRRGIRSMVSCQASK